MFACASVAHLPVYGVALFVAALVVAPLWIARRAPATGAWVALCMLGALPFALGLSIESVDRLLVVAHWRCGTPRAMMLMSLPFVVLALQLPLLAVWFARAQLARVWPLLATVAIVGVVALLGPATLRHLGQGGPPTREQALARMSSTVVTVEGDRTVHEVAGVEIRTTRCPERCVVTAAVLGQDDAEPVEILHGEEPSDRGPVRSVIVHRLGGKRIITIPGRPYATAAVELGSPGKVEIHVHDVAGGFGPPAAILILGWLGVIAVVVSTVIGVQQGRVWRRLGAKGPVHLAELPDVVAMRMTHLAVLAWVAVPLIASVRAGLVG